MPGGFRRCCRGFSERKKPLTAEIAKKRRKGRKEKLEQAKEMIFSAFFAAFLCDLRG